MLPQSAYADALEDIAARSNSIAAKEKAAKEKAAGAGDSLFDAAGGALINGAFALVAVAAGGLVLQFAGAGSKMDISLGGKEERRPLTEAEKRKYKNLSAKEKKELGVRNQASNSRPIPWPSLSICIPPIRAGGPLRRETHV